MHDNDDVKQFSQTFDNLRLRIAVNIYKPLCGILRNVFIVALRPRLERSRWRRKSKTVKKTQENVCPPAAPSLLGRSNGRLPPHNIPKLCWSQHLCDLDTPKPGVSGNYTVHKKYLSIVHLSWCQYEKWLVCESGTRFMQLTWIDPVPGLIGVNNGAVTRPKPAHGKM